MQHIDINTWLIGDILQKGDKMSMASSIELRVPYLDKDVLSVSKNLKLNQKISNNNTKVLLREAFKNLVPKHVLEKKKLGFPTPIRVWLKSDLGKVVRDTILDSKVDNYINKDYIIKLLDEHIDGKKDNSRKVWTVYIFCLWHQIFIENKEIKY
jgi:asparagine synthase (glutamine-hydrolysing)